MLMIAYFPAIMLYFDSPRYARIDSTPLFGDFWMPAGYPILLKVLHTLSDQLWVTIAVQHAMGIGLGIIVYLIFCRLGMRRWVASLAAAVPLLSGDQLYLEHIIMADHFFGVLAAVGLSTAVASFLFPYKLSWIVVGSTLLTFAALTRSVGIVLVPILLIVIVIWVITGPEHRWAAVGAVIVPSLIVFALYFAARAMSHGEYLGLYDMRGWNLYSRVAPFADCGKFTPPEGTAILCEQTPPSQRPGPFGYIWDTSSIARRAFALGPRTGRKLEAFAKKVILHQPGDYAGAVLTDLARYIYPSIAPPRPYSGQPRELVSFGWRDSSVENMVVRAMSRGYRGTSVRLHGRALLGFYQNVFRVNGLILCALISFSVVGMVKATGPRRFATLLFGLSGFALYAVPVLTVSYNFRYGIPAETLLVMSGLLGAGSLFGRALVREEGS